MRPCYWAVPPKDHYALKTLLLNSFGSQKAYVILITGNMDKGEIFFSFILEINMLDVSKTGTII